MMGNNPNLELVNIDVYAKFGQMLSIRSQDIERKQNSGVIPSKQKVMGNNVDIHTKFG